jgi:hypothetical protein
MDSHKTLHLIRYICWGLFLIGLILPLFVSSISLLFSAVASFILGLIALVLGLVYNESWVGNYGSTKKKNAKYLSIVQFLVYVVIGVYFIFIGNKFVSSIVFISGAVLILILLSLFYLLRKKF